MSDKPAFDMIAQAFSGTMYMTGDPEGPPMPVGQSIADVMTGVHAVAAIGYALFHRERTGKGQFLDIAMVDSLFHSQELAVQGPSLTGMRWKPKGQAIYQGLTAHLVPSRGHKNGSSSNAWKRNGHAL